MPIHRFNRQLFDLPALRQSLGYSQADMAGNMGMSLRAYQELEADRDKIRVRHIKLAKFVALEAAHTKRDPMLMPDSVRAMVFDLATVLRGAPIGS